MENLTSPLQKKIDHIKQMLQSAIPNGLVYDVRKWHDWVKYEVVCEANKSFLCVSNEFLEDLDEAEMSERFEREGVARAMQANPKGRFELTRNGLARGSCD